jgi:hypothetical protein
MYCGPYCLYVLCPNCSVKEQNAVIWVNICHITSKKSEGVSHMAVKAWSHAWVILKRGEDIGHLQRMVGTGILRRAVWLICKGNRHMGQPKTRWLHLVSKTWIRESRGDRKLTRNGCGRDWRLFTEPVWCRLDEKRKKQKLLSKVKAQHFSSCFL